ncbi:MAG: sulfur reduction protein DsrE [Chromatiales bacterium 21-64-14]|nr:MAG: sulfur reduction protein DsrE [Chromatiales bacterium 21-64-14]
MENNQYIADDGDKVVVIIMTSGPSSPQRCATPFYLGSLLAAMDAEVHVFFTMEGVRLMEKGVGEQLAAMEGGKRIIDFVRDAKRAGVKLHVCQPALPGYKIDENLDLIDEVDYISKASTLADLILSCDKVFSF